MASSSYTASDIEVLSGLDPVRRRPGMYTDTTRPNHLAHEVVVTPWEQKGTVMRTLVEQSKLTIGLPDVPESRPHSEISQANGWKGPTS